MFDVFKFSILGVCVEINFCVSGVDGYEIEGIWGFWVFGVRDFFYRLVFFVCCVVLINLRFGGKEFRDEE